MLCSGGPRTAGTQHPQRSNATAVWSKAWSLIPFLILKRREVTFTYVIANLD